MMEYEVLLGLKQDLNDGKYNYSATEFVKIITLPFIPFIGLEMFIADETTKRIKTIIWDIDNNRFVAVLDDLRVRTEETKDRNIKELTAYGWEILSKE